MKTYLGLRTILLVTILFGFYSCTKDRDPRPEVPEVTTPTGQDTVIIGRFDNTPFVWDDVYSLNNSPDNIYIGDILINVSDGLSANTRAGRSNGRPSGGSTETNTNLTDNITVLNPAGIYIGAAYPESALPYKFDKEITRPKNPIDVVFLFSSPFIAEITKEAGSIGYIKALKDAINSGDYKLHVNSDKEAVLYSMTQFNSYQDLEKGFSNNTKFGALFSAQVKINSSKVSTKTVGKLFARLTSSNFTSYMDTPTEAKGFFKNPDDNKFVRGQELGVYIRSITYGKVVYVAIESEYQYSEVKFALEASLKFSFGSTSASVKQRVTEIFNKSAITIFAISDNSTQSFFIDGMKNLETLFTAKYTNQSYGFPIFIQGRYVHDNGAYYPKDESTANPRPPSRPTDPTRPPSRPPSRPRR